MHVLDATKRRAAITILGTAAALTLAPRSQAQPQGGYERPARRDSIVVRLRASSAEQARLRARIESLLSKNPNPFAEAMALQVIRTVASWLPVAVADGTNMEARGQLLLASHLAGMGQASGTGVGLVHAIGHALGTRGRLPHGTALAAVLPEVLAFYAEHAGLRDRELALAAVAIGAASPTDDWAEATRAGIAGLDGFLRRVGQRPTLADLGVEEALVGVIAQDALEDPAIANSPRLPDRDQVEAILRAVSG